MGFMAPNGPIPGEAPARSVEAPVDRTGVKYLPDEDAIQYVAGWEHRDQKAFIRGKSTTRDPVYEMAPLDRWLQNESARIAMSHVDDLLADRLEGETEVSASVTSCDSDGPVVRVYLTELTLDPRGRVVRKASVEIQEVAEAAPASVTVKLTFTDQCFERSMPVTVVSTVMRL